MTIPTAPAWLTDEARQHWDRVAPQAEANNTLDPNHHYAFAVMCESLADMVHLQKVIRAEGLTVPGADNNVKAHPALRQLESCRAHCLKMLESFGLTARSKKQVKETPPKDDDNPFAFLDEPDPPPTHAELIRYAQMRQRYKAVRHPSWDEYMAAEGKTWQDYLEEDG